MSTPESSQSIPNGLTQEHRSVYEVILRTVNNRPKNFKIPRIVAITDVGKDYDDLTALIVLKELHRLGAIKLEGVVANLIPSHKRAHLARKALDSLLLQDIPVGQGTVGVTGKDQDRYKETPPFEFPEEIMGKEPYPDYEEGVDLLQRLGKEATKGDYKFTFLLISSQQDIAEFKRKLQPDPQSRRQPLKDITSKVILQGAYYLEAKDSSGNKVLKASTVAANNTFNMGDSEEFHTFLDQHEVPSVVYTREAAYATPLTPGIFKSLAAIGHPLGQLLSGIQEPQDSSFYEGCCQVPCFRQGCDQPWFLTNRTNFYDTHPRNTSDKDLPKGDEILPYCKIIVYDALAALGTAGDDMLNALDVLQKPDYTKELIHSELHRVVGIEQKSDNNADGSLSAKKPPVASTNSKNMKNVIEALLMGALLDCRARGVQCIVKPEQDDVSRGRCKERV
ncbi:hypothetical protein NHQ30_000040 [Ciborinia camelliae]|nr:hypothetical protein NHQ30_000040 [Ciborinia camelliae]